MAQHDNAWGGNGRMPLLPEGSAGARILIIDDDHELVDLLRFSLGRAGFEFSAACEPSEALGLFALEEPDLVLLDLRLGPWDGLELLTAIRRRSREAV